MCKSKCLSWIAFTAWKEEEEKSTYSFFIQPKGAVESMTTSDMGKLLNLLFTQCQLFPSDAPAHTVTYICCRDGNKRGHVGSNKSGKSRMGRHSRKLNDFCTTRIIATVNNGTGEVSVKYISHHTNHKLGVSEYRNLQLPPSVKEDIREQFVQ